MHVGIRVRVGVWATFSGSGWQVAGAADQCRAVAVKSLVTSTRQKGYHYQGPRGGAEVGPWSGQELPLSTGIGPGGLPLPGGAGEQ